VPFKQKDIGHGINIIIDEMYCSRTKKENVCHHKNNTRRRKIITLLLLRTTKCERKGRQYLPYKFAKPMLFLLILVLCGFASVIFVPYLADKYRGRQACLCWS